MAEIARAMITTMVKKDASPLQISVPVALPVVLQL
jgi:hypothetical protein